MKNHLFKFTCRYTEVSVSVFSSDLFCYASGVLNYNPGTFNNYVHHWVDATAGGRFVPEGITSPVVNTLVLT